MRYLSQVPKFRCLVFQVKSSSSINSRHPLPPPCAPADNPCLPDASDSRLQTLSLPRRAKVFPGLSEKLVSVFTGFPFDRMPHTETVPNPRRTLTGCRVPERPQFKDLGTFGSTRTFRTHGCPAFRARSRASGSSSGLSTELPSQPRLLAAPTMSSSGRSSPGTPSPTPPISPRSLSILY